MTRPDSSRTGPPRALRIVLAALAAAVLVVAGLALALILSGRDVADPGPPLGAVLDDTDRRALDATPVRRGAPPPPADPTVDLTDPVAVARAYLAAARSIGADDGGRTQLRAAAYAVPGSPPAAVGVVVLDAPGQVHSAAVTGLDLITTDQADRRRGYRATVRMTIRPPNGPARSPTVPGPDPPNGAATTSTTAAYVVVARQPDGRWLVAADTSDLLDADD